MSRNLFSAELGFEILGLNEDTGVSILKGAAVPGGDAGLQDDAAIGSMYLRENGEIYQKLADTNATSDWERYAKLSDVQALEWKDKLKVLTADAAPAEGAVKDATAFSDNDAPTLSGADFAVGDRILFGNGTTPVIGEVSGISGDDLTITYIGVEAIGNNHTYVVEKYLPDSANQENEAIVHYDGSAALIKLADVDWSLATGINLSGAYTAAAGDVIAGDSVEAAIAKLDGNLDNASLILGRDVQSDSDMGAYAGTIINDNESAKENIAQLEAFIEALPVPRNGNADSVTAATVVDTVLVDSVRAVKYLVSLTLASDESKVESFEMFCHHDGTASADAAGTDDTVYASLKLNGGIAGLQAKSVVLSGSGTSQTMGLEISSPAAVNVRFTAIDVKI